MNRAALAVGFALAGVAMLLAPAAAMLTDVLHDRVGSMDDDIVIASLVAGSVHAALTWRGRERSWIAMLNALAVLALGGSVLLLLVLVLFPDEHLTLDHRGAPVTVTWLGVQLVAVALAEAAARLTVRWVDRPLRAAR